MHGHFGLRQCLLPTVTLLSAGANIVNRYRVLCVLLWIMSCVTCDPCSVMNQHTIQPGPPEGILVALVVLLFIGPALLCSVTVVPKSSVAIN